MPHSSPKHIKTKCPFLQCWQLWVCSLSLCWTPVGYQRWSHSGCFVPSACGLWWVVVETIILPCIPSWRPSGKPLAWEHCEEVRQSPGCTASLLRGTPPVEWLTLHGVRHLCRAACLFPMPGKHTQPPGQGARAASLPALGVVDTFYPPCPGRCSMESLCGGNLCFLTSWEQWTTRHSLAHSLAHSVLNVTLVVCFLLSQAGVFQLGVEKYSCPGNKSPQMHSL